MIVATILFSAAIAFSPEYGVVAKAIRRRRIRSHILEEDVLKSLDRLGSSAELPAIHQIVGMHATVAQIDIALQRLAKRDLVRREGARSILTDAGRERAEMLVRSHRLWETYLAEHNVPEEMVHEVAERLEHAHDLAEEVATELGHPDRDPHGEPIPGPPAR